jgi:tryptophan synthase beta chain
MKNRGYFGNFGGAYLPEILVATFDELESVYNDARSDPAFWQEYETLMASYSCRPTPITFAENLTRHFGGAKIFIKREDLNHTGAHKANNVMGQGLLVKRMGKTRVIAETGAGQHGVATATMAARFGFDCTIYMGAVDVETPAAQCLLDGAVGRHRGSGNRRDGHFERRHQRVLPGLGYPHGFHPLCAGHGLRPAPVSGNGLLVPVHCRQRSPKADFGNGREVALKNICLRGRRLQRHGNLQRVLRRRRGTGGVEAAGKGLDSGEHASRLCSSDASIGVAQGYKTYFLQDDDGQMKETHSIAAGLDYVGVSPILSDLKEKGRVRFEGATDAEVIEAVSLTMRKEGVIPALESAHGFARAFKEAPDMSPDEIILINQSGRGDKDIFTIADAFDDPKWKQFIIEKARQYNA